MFEDVVNCHKCLNQDRPDHQIEYQRKIMGCYGIKPQPIPTFSNVNDLRYYTCIGNFAWGGFHYLWYGFRVWQENKTDVWDMPAKLVEIYQILENLLLEKQAQEAEKAQKKNKGSHGRQPNRC